jgi:hypothetical protein
LFPPHQCSLFNLGHIENLQFSIDEAASLQPHSIRSVHRSIDSRGRIGRGVGEYAMRSG